jgi:8-oxo-dGTP pyrophosphatase MutT (NUDIX family)
LRRLARAAQELTAGDFGPSRAPSGGGRRSAVLVLFGEGPAGPDVLLIRRSDALRQHAGQPAFPGGAVDTGDGDAVATALREAAEETGLDPTCVEILATMADLYLPPSGFLVTPVLGWWHTPCAVAPSDPGEVAEVVRVPIRDIVDPANRLRVHHPSGRTGPGFQVGGLLVWGFTAGLLARLLEAGGLLGPAGELPTVSLPPSPGPPPDDALAYPESAPVPSPGLAPGKGGGQG